MCIHVFFPPFRLGLEWKEFYSSQQGMENGTHTHIRKYICTYVIHFVYIVHTGMEVHIKIQYYVIVQFRCSMTQPTASRRYWSH